MLDAWFPYEMILYIANTKAYRLEISGPSLRFLVTYMRTVRIQPGTRVSRLGPATETKCPSAQFALQYGGFCNM